MIKKIKNLNLNLNLLHNRISSAKQEEETKKTHINRSNSMRKKDYIEKKIVVEKVTVFQNTNFTKTIAIFKKRYTFQLPLIFILNKIKGYSYAHSLFFMSFLGITIIQSLQKLLHYYNEKEKRLLILKFKFNLFKNKYLNDINNYKTIKEIKKEYFKILKLKGGYKNSRYLGGYPLRGQRTKSNSKTRRKRRII